MHFKKGDLVSRLPEDQKDYFWDCRRVRDCKGLDGVYCVSADSEGNTLCLVGLGRAFDARKFRPVSFKKLESWA